YIGAPVFISAVLENLAIEICALNIGAIEQIFFELFVVLCFWGFSNLAIVSEYFDFSCFVLDLVYLCVCTWMKKLLFYALDLGGTNFRVMWVQLRGKGSKTKQESKEVSIPPHLMVGSSHFSDAIMGLWLMNCFFIVAALQNLFLRKKKVKSFMIFISPGLAKGALPFSFSVRQLSLESGTLIKWLNGFLIEDAAHLQKLKELN
ncbi:hexokinase, partial [Striga asiatica]